MIIDRNMKDIMGLSPEKKIESELGKGTRLSMTLAHLHLAACLTSLKEYQQARREAKQAVKYMVETVKDPDARHRNEEINIYMLLHYTILALGDEPEDIQKVWASIELTRFQLRR